MEIRESCYCRGDGSLRWGGYSLGAGDISKAWGIAYRQETLLIVSSAERKENTRSIE